MITNRLIGALTVAALIIAVAFGLKAATAAGVIDQDQSRQIMQILIGLGLAAYANLMPKQIGSARRSPLVQARTQAALRVGGWAFTLAGLTQAGLWAFAPLGIADTGSMVAVAGAMAVTLGYAIWCYAACRAAPVGR